MKIFDVSNKHLLPLLSKIVSEKLNKETRSLKYIGGGSFGRVFKALISDGETIALKSYVRSGLQNEEACQIEYLSQNTSIKMPKVLFTYEDKESAVMAMTFVEGKNVLSPEFLFRSKKIKKAFANDVIDGMLEWHNVTGEKF